MAAQFDATQLDAGDEKTKFSDFFIFQRVLGSGSFGVVVSALMKPCGRECAVKIIQKKSLRTKNLSAFGKESQILQQLDHPNIVKFIAINETETRIFLAMELVRGGQLQNLLSERKKAGKPLSDEEAASIMKGIFEGLRYIHLKDIVHRDLKPENILLDNKDDLTSVKICDFGLSAQYNDATCTRSFNEKCGTDIFMAPELWKNRSYSKPVDMWSCGIIMYMLLSGGKHPFYENGEQRESYLKKLEAAQWPMLPNFNRYSKDLFLKVVLQEPTERYTVEQVRNHPWITRRFNEDIPLTSSEKIAAFSHSQIFSRLIKSVYLIYGTETEGYKDPVVPKKYNEEGETMATQSDEEPYLAYGKPKINVIKAPNNEHTVAVSGLAQHALRIEPNKARYNMSPQPGEEKKAAIMHSHSHSHMKPPPNPRQVRPRKESNGSGMRSFGDLESTLKCNVSGQVEDKPKYFLPSANDMALVTEPIKTLEDEITKEENSNAVTGCELGKAASAGVSFGYNYLRRRNSKSNRIPDKVINSYYQDTSSVDMGLQFESIRSEKPGAALVRHKIMGSVGNLSNMESISNIENLQQSEKQATLQRPQNLMNRNEDTHSMCDLTRDQSRFNSPEKRSDVEEIRKLTIKRRETKGATVDSTAFPNLDKAKLRQYSLPSKKKVKKDKSAGKVQKLLSMTNGGGTASQPYGLGVNGMSCRTVSGDNRISIIEQKCEEKQLEVYLARKKNPSLLRAFKTPQREDREDQAGLPQIKYEMKKTKRSFIASSEKGLVQRNMGALANPTPALNRTTSRISKPITPFRNNKE